MLVLLTCEDKERKNYVGHGDIYRFDKRGLSKHSFTQTLSHTLP